MYLLSPSMLLAVCYFVNILLSELFLFIMLFSLLSLIFSPWSTSHTGRGTVRPSQARFFFSSSVSPCSRFITSLSFQLSGLFFFVFLLKYLFYLLQVLVVLVQVFGLAVCLYPWQCWSSPTQRSFRSSLSSLFS